MGTMFPGPGAIIYRNGAGEVTGWDEEGSFEPEYHPCCGVTGRCICGDLDDEDDDEKCYPGEHTWVCGPMAGSVMTEDLDKVYEKKRCDREPGPYCETCGTEYNPTLHGESLED